MSNLDGRVSDGIVKSLEAKILNGELLDGQPLPPERNLMQEYGSSRTVIREAVLALAGKGLLETRPRHRPIVRKPGADTALRALESSVSHLLEETSGLRHLFQTRILIESGLVEYAAMHAKKDDLKALKSALEANEAAIEQSGVFFESDKAFHRVLYMIPANPVWAALFTLYEIWLFAKWGPIPEDRERNETNYLAHKAIYDAILMRDPQMASQALRAHLQVAWEHFDEKLDASN